MAQLEDGETSSRTGTSDPSARLDVETFKAAMGRFATGVAVVTAIEGGAPVGFTCQSIVSLSLDPLLVGLAPAKSSTSWPRIAQAGAFCVNVLRTHQARLAASFAVSGANKFVDVSWRPGLSGAPRLDDSLAYVDCRLELVHDAGDHEIVVGRVLDVSLGDGNDPLVFYARSYRELGGDLGRAPGDSLS